MENLKINQNDEQVETLSIRVRVPKNEKYPREFDGESIRFYLEVLSAKPCHGHNLLDYEIVHITNKDYKYLIGYAIKAYDYNGSDKEDIAKAVKYVVDMEGFGWKGILLDMSEAPEEDREKPFCREIFDKYKWNDEVSFDDLIISKEDK